MVQDIGFGSQMNKQALVEFSVPVDFCPIWLNSVQIATLQMIGHALLSTNFHTLQPHFQTGLTIQRLGVQIPAEVGNFLIFETVLVQTANWQ